MLEPPDDLLRARRKGAATERSAGWSQPPNITPEDEILAANIDLVRWLRTQRRDLPGIASCHSWLTHLLECRTPSDIEKPLCIQMSVQAD
jgi:hypothetical protein